MADGYAFSDFLADSLATNPDFKRLWDDDEIYRETGLSLIDARNSAELSQRDLAAKTGIAQGDISKIERGNGNPSLKTLKRLAEGMGMKAVSLI